MKIGYAKGNTLKPQATDIPQYGKTQKIVAEAYEQFMPRPPES